MRLNLPLDRETARSLHAGQAVELYGPVYTARDATHMRLIQELEATGELPYNLAGQTLFYAGPTPAAAGRPAGAVGPTTARRMDAATPALQAAGITATIGKGRRAQEVIDSCRQTGSVYLGAVGGAAALLAQHVSSATPIAYPELGTEALVRFELEGFPAFVAIDTQGGDYYAEGPQTWQLSHHAQADAHDTPAPAMPKTARADFAAPRTHPPFITFEGGEGAGKSSQIIALRRQLEMHGIPVTVVREPGGTAVGESIRGVLLDTRNTDMAPLAELMLYEAARAQVVQEIINPALAAGHVVLCDRFTDSTIAYQGYGRALDPEVVAGLNHVATGGLTPDRTLVLDADPALGLQRATRKRADRMELEERAFHDRVREGFHAIAQQDPHRVRLISSEGPIVEVFIAVLHEVADLFPQVWGDAQ